MKLIPLTQGFSAMVDDEDFEKVSTLTWIVDKHKNTNYARHHRLINGKLALFRMHQFIMGMPTLEVDHKDGNGLNNQKYNLRVCTRVQNAQNLRISTTNKSGIKGVFWRADKNKWIARINFFGNQKHIGYYTTREAAADAYAEASAKYHGEFGRVDSKF